VALRAGEQERLGQGRDCACVVAGGGQRQRPQCADLDKTAGTVLGGCRGVQPVQQWPVLGCPPRRVQSASKRVIRRVSLLAC
jgi:hypothetical protein